MDTIANAFFTVVLPNIIFIARVNFLNTILNNVSLSLVYHIA